MNDKQTLKRLNAIIKDIQRNCYDGIGKPEPLLKVEGLRTLRLFIFFKICYNVKKINLTESLAKKATKYTNVSNVRIEGKEWIYDEW